jgi:hypothetical protein
MFLFEPSKQWFELGSLYLGSTQSLELTRSQDSLLPTQKMNCYHGASSAVTMRYLGMTPFVRNSQLPWDTDNSLLLLCCF